MTIDDRSVSLEGVVVAILWGLSLALILAGSIVGLASDTQMVIATILMVHGLVTSAAAATFTIRRTINQQNRFMRNLFELGQDYGSPIRKLR